MKASYDLLLPAKNFHFLSCIRKKFLQIRDKYFSILSPDQKAFPISCGVQCDTVKVFVCFAKLYSIFGKFAEFHLSSTVQPPRKNFSFSKNFAFDMMHDIVSPEFGPDAIYIQSLKMKNGCTFSLSLLYIFHLHHSCNLSCDVSLICSFVESHNGESEYRMRFFILHSIGN